MNVDSDTTENTSRRGSRMLGRLLVGSLTGLLVTMAATGTAAAAEYDCYRFPVDDGSDSLWTWADYDLWVLEAGGAEFSFENPEVGTRISSGNGAPIDFVRKCTVLQPVPVVEEPAPEVPVVEEPAPEVPVVEEPGPEVPVVEEPGPEVPVVEEPAPEVPVVEEPGPEVPVVEEPGPEVPVVEEPAPEVPVVEEPAPEVPSDDSSTGGDQPEPKRFGSSPLPLGERVPTEPAPTEPTPTYPDTPLLFRFTTPGGSEAEVLGIQLANTGPGLALPLAGAGLGLVLLGLSAVGTSRRLAAPSA